MSPGRATHEGGPEGSDHSLRGRLQRCSRAPDTRAGGKSAVRGHGRMDFPWTEGWGEAVGLRRRGVPRQVTLPTGHSRSEPAAEKDGRKRSTQGRAPDWERRGMTGRDPEARGRIGRGRQGISRDGTRLSSGRGADKARREGVLQGVRTGGWFPRLKQGLGERA